MYVGGASCFVSLHAIVSSKTAEMAMKPVVRGMAFTLFIWVALCTNTTTSVGYLLLLHSTCTMHSYTSTHTHNSFQSDTQPSPAAPYFKYIPVPETFRHHIHRFTAPTGIFSKVQNLFCLLLQFGIILLSTRVVFIHIY